MKALLGWVFGVILHVEKDRCITCSQIGNATFLVHTTQYRVSRGQQLVLVIYRFRIINIALALFLVLRTDNTVYRRVIRLLGVQRLSVL